MTKLGEKIVEMHRLGNSYSQIKDALGCSKGTIAYYCGSGQKEKSVERARNGRRLILAFLQQYKQERGCTDCGENYPYWMLQFDHLHSKEFNLGKFDAKTTSLDKVKKEVEKCEVVYANCHANRTHMRTTGKYSMSVEGEYS